jgi:hypothetical protein
VSHPFVSAVLGFNHLLVFVMAANPNPNEVFAIFDSKCPVSNACTNRPEISNFLEMERWMPGVGFE